MICGFLAMVVCIWECQRELLTNTFVLRNMYLCLAICIYNSDCIQLFVFDSCCQIPGLCPWFCLRFYFQLSLAWWMKSREESKPKHRCEKFSDNNLIFAATLTVSNLYQNLCRCDKFLWLCQIFYLFNFYVTNSPDGTNKTFCCCDKFLWLSQMFCLSMWQILKPTISLWQILPILSPLPLTVWPPSTPSS